MRELVSQIEQFQKRFSKLLDKNRLQREEILYLKEENERLKLVIEELEERMVQINQENTTLKTANALLGSSSHITETKIKINRIIKEIDYCVVALSKE